jgi:hypothetical protein
MRNNNNNNNSTKLPIPETQQKIPSVFKPNETESTAQEVKQDFGADYMKKKSPENNYSTNTEHFNKEFNVTSFNDSNGPRKEIEPVEIFKMSKTARNEAATTYPENKLTALNNTISSSNLPNFEVRNVHHLTTPAIDKHSISNESDTSSIDKPSNRKETFQPVEIYISTGIVGHCPNSTGWIVCSCLLLGRL